MPATGSAYRVLVYGGKGALGSTVVSHFVKEGSCWVASVDFTANEEAHANCVPPTISTPTGTELMDQSDWLMGAVAEKLGAADGAAVPEENKLDAIFCVAGGWAGGNAASKDFIKNVDLTTHQSIWTSVLAAEMASKYLKTGGVLVLTGAQAALSPTPNMIGYGMAKAAVHHLTKSLAAEKSGMPEKSTVLSILPITLDTPMNRKWMPKADHSTWTPLEFIADLFAGWLKEPAKRPANGSLLQLLTKEGKTDIVAA